MSAFGPLNLADADLKGFEAVEPGRYNAEVFEITMDAVKNASGTGKMPAGTPMVKVQFKLTDPEVENKRAWVQYVIPPDSYDPNKAAKLKGMLARFFMALGDSEESVMSGSFDPDFEDYIGRGCVVVLGKEQRRDGQGNLIADEFNNPVKGVKPAGSIAGVEASSGLL
jgi:hypothetical protein